MTELTVKRTSPTPYLRQCTVLRGRPSSAFMRWTVPLMDVGDVNR